MAAPKQIKDIPDQIINELAAYGPFDLKPFFESDEKLTFQAETKDRTALPKGMICTGDGILTGIPSKNTEGNYEVVLTVENASGAIDATLFLIIKPSNITSPDYFDKLKAQVWEAVEQRLPIPDLTELSDKPISFLEFYYLLERWGILTIWDAFNLDPAGEKKLLELPGISPHYEVYDRGSCIVGCPKDLFSHERTLPDGLRTARAMAREVYQRNWTVELIGFDKLKRAAWVELQLLVNTIGRRILIKNAKLLAMITKPNASDRQTLLSDAELIPGVIANLTSETMRHSGYRKDQFSLAVNGNDVIFTIKNAK